MTPYRRTISAMRWRVIWDDPVLRPVLLSALAMIALALLLSACSSPTTPTPIPSTTVATTPPITPSPSPVPTPSPAPSPTPPPQAAPNPLLLDPQFSLTFYRMFVNNALEAPTQLQPLRRQTQPPRIYLRTLHDNGRAIDEFTLNQTADALINTTGQITGVFGLAGLERGTGTRLGQPGWITVSWKDDPERRYCGRAAIAGDWVELYPNTPRCRCSGGPLVSLSTVKHELGHALGFYHSNGLDDLMYPNIRECNQSPSSREIFHARVA